MNDKQLREAVYQRMLRDCRSNFDPWWLRYHIDTCSMELILAYADVYGVRY